MANFNFNKVILGGRLTADPELKTTPSGISVTSFTVAVNRNFKGPDGKSAADFLSVTAWRGTAEFITRYFRKASSICVVGSIQTRSWMDQNGQKRFATEIVADEAYFVDAMRESPFARGAAQVEVDPSAAVMAGEDQSAAGPMPETVYATPGARDGIGGAEGDEGLPF